MNSTDTHINIEDNKEEKIAFIVDFDDEIYNKDFTATNGEKYDRLAVIFDEITNFCRLKDYLNSKTTEFAFYIYTNKLTKVIDFAALKDFLPNFNDHKKVIQDIKFSKSNVFDLSEIFTEGLNSLVKENSNEKIVRFILFYNRSDTISVISNSKEHNLITFIRLTNFFFDVMFIRRKLNSDEDKKLLSDVFNSLTSVKPKFWYAFENSGNLNKMKFTMNLLLANANQRIKLSDIDKFQKSIEEIVKNYIDA